MWQLPWVQVRTSAKRFEHSIEWMCTLYKCSISQLINEHLSVNVQEPAVENDQWRGRKCV
jgi:hypothetical protein